MQPLLVIDVSYMCHRAFHTTRGLSYKGNETGVIFGFLKSIGALKDEFQTDRIAFCFDSPHLLRRDIYPAYKKRRQDNRTEEEQKAYGALQYQILKLWEHYLPMIGFKNVFRHDGYEADDLLAVIADSVEVEDGEVILVTADQDLLQCLDANVWMYSPAKAKLYGWETFVVNYGIGPFQWARVKAIAGCSGDGIKGIKGIGEKTALKFVQGKLPQDSKAYQSIFSKQGKAIVRRNRKLVQLPFEGCPVPVIKEDGINEEGWKEVCATLGMRTLAGRPPIASRRGFQLGLKA